MTFQSFIACCSTSSECIAYLINYTYSTIGKKWRKTLLFNPFLQWLPKEKARVFPIVPITIYSTAHYHPENDDDVLKIKTRNKQDTRWYTQQVLYTNQWLEYNSMLVYTVVLSAVNLLLLIPDHLVGKEAFLLGEIMMSLFAEVAAKSLVWKQQILLSLMDCFLSKH